LRASTCSARQFRCDQLVKENFMNAKHLIWTLAAASLLAPESLGAARAQTAQHEQHAANTADTLPGAVRQATERFRDVDAAIAAGYVQFQGCVSGPEEGAMGVHYVNPALFDGQLEVEHPEALVYEPKNNGRLQLVAVEYITPAEAWHAGHQVGVQPDLMGHLFHFAPGPNRYGPDAFYELHVWAWKTNPRSVFADWNPTVSCADWEGTTF
jgi:hypothetical protein